MRWSRSSAEARVSTFRWLGFVDWLGGEIGGRMLATAWHVFGSEPLRRLAQQEAQAVGPWLLAVLEARQRLGLTLTAGRDILLAPLVAADTSICPLTASELSRDATWRGWLLVEELLRLVRLEEAPPQWLAEAAWEARHRGLAASLIRIRQLSTALEQGEGREAAQQARIAAAAAARRQASEAAQAA